MTKEEVLKKGLCTSPSMPCQVCRYSVGDDCTVIEDTKKEEVKEIKEEIKEEKVDKPKKNKVKKEKVKKEEVEEEMIKEESEKSKEEVKVDGTNGTDTEK